MKTTHMKSFIQLSFMCLLSLVSLHTMAHEDHTKHQKTTLAVSMAFGAKGQLWRATTTDGFVWVDTSSDLGKTFNQPIKLNTESQKIGADGEARPKIAISDKGDIYVTWTQMLKQPFTGYIWFARSQNQGKTFEKPMIVHQDRAEITHRFDALHVAPDGVITVLWIDKRDLVAAKAANKAYAGAAIYYAQSTDKGATFKPEQKLADSSCECCRIATATSMNGGVVALWRHVYATNERDHAMAEISKGRASEPKRASFGRWVIDGCPHQGGALALGAGFGYHMAYFDGQDKKPGLYVSRMDGEAWVTSPAKKFGDNSKSASHPDLLSIGENVWLVWRETQGTQHQIFGMTSDDGGRSWNEAKLLTKADGKVDYPFLMANQKQVYLSWNTANGLQIMPLN